MRTKIILSIVAAYLLAIDVSAQTSITSQYNGYRDDDKLYRIVANDTTLGNRGDSCVWKLPAAQDDDNFFKQTVYLRNDSLTIVENDLMLHYIATEQGLSIRGFQTRDMYSVQDTLSLELKYPFAYGDSISDTFSRTSTYYNTFTVRENGSCYTVCDGRGILTDGEETLKDVLRVHYHSTTISEYNNVEDGNALPEVSEVTEDKYVWYYPGCRYPVMDTRIITSKSNGEIIADTTFTSLYLPEVQLAELPYDDDNSELIAQREALEQSSGQGGSDDEGEKPFPITMSATLQANHTEITLDYFVSEETDATFYACDMAGRLLGCVTHLSLSEGEHHETMVLKNRPINSIVMLTMVVGNRQEVLKVR